MKSSWFTDRCKEMDYLNINLKNIIHDSGEHIAVLGPRKIGKTELLKKFVNEKDRLGSLIICYVNFQSIISSLEVFTTRYVGKILYKTLESARFLNEEYNPAGLFDFSAISRKLPLRENLSWESIVSMAEMISPEIRQWAVDFINLMESNHPSMVALFERAMNFPEFLAQKLNIRYLVAIDEFHEIQNLTTFKELKKIDKLLFTIFSSHKKVNYLVSASQMDIAASFFNSPKSPFFSFFKILELGNFKKEDSSLLIQKIFRSSGIKNFDPLILPRIYRLSLGHPFSITAVCREAVNIAIYDNRNDITMDIVDKAFVLETLSSEGRIFLKCDYILYYALNSVKGGNTLRAIILILAEQDGLKLKDIAKKMCRPAGQVRGYLLLMIKADLLVKKEDRYYFRNPLLRFWTAYQENYIRYNYGLSKELTKEIAEDYITRFLYETRHAFPGYSFAARTMCFLNKISFEGAYFGAAGTVKLPQTGARLYFAENDTTGMVLGVPALIDFDFIYEVCESKAESVIIIDSCEKSQMAESLDVDLFARKIDYYKRKSGKKVILSWLICEKGHTRTALKDAKEKGIYLTDITKTSKIHEQLLRRAGIIQT